MCQAKDIFDVSEYEYMNSIPDLGRDPEELKRATLIMSLTAWETYVEDKISEEVALPGYEDPERTQSKLNEWIKKRGEAVHRSVADKQTTHLISKPEAEKCIKSLAEATHNALTE
ncbi:hypothetical protein NDJ22_19820 [Vibrio alginolyticus]|uniref:hypothetical protein n=1 Tax=Vibrio alginolyticus TaxID=663 RepID=UPI002160DC60|nr:hypothetical protein [Vibrio alginolyticus]MCS0267266.1 hypothetical protein [Vibrio alginolyticus]